MVSCARSDDRLLSSLSLRYLIRVHVSGQEEGLRFGLGVRGLMFDVWCLVFGVWCLLCVVWGLWFKVSGLELKG